MGGRLCNRDVAIFGAMVATEFSNVFVNTLFKAASSKGLSSYVFLTYAYAIGALLLLPFTFFSLRSSLLPPLSFSILCKMGLLGLIVSTFQIAGYTGIKLSSPTLSSAMANVTPAFTFLLAVIFRMETVSINKKSSLAKVMGTIVSIGGAFVATLYHGPSLFLPSPPSVFLREPPLSSDWAIGGGLLAFQFTLVSVSYILLAHVMSRYPNTMAVTFSHNLVISIVCALVGMIAEKNNPEAWTIRFDITLISIVATGVLNTAYYVIHSWAVRYKGPLFLSLFRPISIIIAILATTIFLGDPLFLGSLIGGALISIGFYTVMWGKAKEEMDIKSSSVASPPSQNVPLLINKEADHV